MQRRKGLGGKEKEFSLDQVELQEVTSHAIRHFGQEVRNVGMEGRGEFWSGEEELGTLNIGKGYVRA